MAATGMPAAGAAGQEAAVMAASVDSVAGLVAAREARGLSAADVVAALKLAPRQVAALEAGDWAALPGLAFTRAALRSYGRLIGVSVEPLTAAMGQGVAAPELREAASLRAPLPRAGVLGFGAGGSGSRLAWVALAIAVLVVVGLFFGRNAAREQDSPARPAGPQAPSAGTASTPPNSPAGATPDPASPAEKTPVALPGAAASSAGLVSAPTGSAPAAPPVPAAPAASSAPLSVPAAPASAPSASAASAPAASAPAASAPAASAPAAPAATAFPMLAPSAREAVLRFERESWVEVRRADGQLVVEGLQRAGTEVRLPLSGELNLVLGNAEFVRVERGGTPVDLKPLIRQGVARLKLAP